MPEPTRARDEAPGARSYHHGDLQRVIIDTTLDLLREGGADAVSIREVARRAGVSPMAPYRHFAGKDALLAAVAAIGFERLRDRPTGERAPDPAADLELETAGYVAFALNNPALFRLMFSARMEGPFPQLNAIRESAYDALRARVQAAAPGADDLEALLLAHWSLMHGLASLILDGKLEHKQLGTPDAIARRTVRAILSRRDTD